MRPSLVKKIAIGTLGTFVAVIVLAAVTLTFFVDWNQYRGTLADLTSERLGVKVELGGDLHLNILPRPALVANAVRIAPLGENYGETIATAERIDMRLGLFAALTGNIQLESLSLDGFSTTLLETSDGWTIEGWPESAPEEQQTASSDQSAEQTSGPALRLDKLHLSGAALTIKRASGQQYALKGLNLELEGTLPTGPLSWRGSVFVSGEQVETSGKLTPTQSDDLALKINILAAGTEMDFSGRLMGADSINGRLQFISDDLSRVGAFAGNLASATVPLPAIPLTIDLQIDREKSLTKVVSRRLQVDEAIGQLDLTVAGDLTEPNVTGSLSLGLLEMEPFLALASGETPAQPSQAAPTVAEGAPEAAPLPVKGSVDLTVEGISYKGELIQNIAVTFTMKDGGVTVSRAQALLPGASRLQYTSSAKNNATGNLSFETSRLPDVLSWAGITLPKDMPTGRFMTADVSARVDIGETDWAIANIDGQFDTSKVKGAIRGSTAPAGLRSVALSIDTLNLDAYWPDNKLPESEEGESAPFDIDMNVAVDRLRLRGEDYRGVRFRGRVSDAQVTVEEATLLHRDGTMKTSGRATVPGGQGAPSEVDFAIAFTGWRFPLVEAFAPSSSEMVAKFAGTGPYSGNVKVTGPLSAMQTSVQMEGSGRSLRLAGVVGQAEPMTLSLQGRYEDKQPFALVGTFVELPDIAEAARTSTQLSLSLDGNLDQLAYKVSGALLSGEVDLSGSYSPKVTTAALNFNTEAANAVPFDALVRAYGDVAFKPGPRRFRATIKQESEKISVTDLSLRAGGEEVSGTLNAANIGADTPAKIAGKLIVTDLDMGRMMASYGGATDTNSPAQPPSGDVPFTGELDLDLRRVSWQGQVLTAPKAKAVFTPEGRAAISFGDSAALNNQPLTASLQYNLADGNMGIDVSAATVDVGALIAGFGGGRVMSGTVSLTTNLSARGDSAQTLLRSLDGQVNFSGGVGSLYFMAVPELVNLMNNSKSSTNFLQSIGGFLRGGQTDFAGFKGALRFDDGVALVQELIASGGWGNLSLDGQLNLPADLMNLKGQLALKSPEGAPAIPVSYEGALTSPTTNWSSRVLERFVLAGIERRVRNGIFGELESAQSGSDAPPASPGTAVLGTAFDLLSKLKKKQEEKKPEGETDKEEPPKKDAPQGSGTQRP